MGGGWGWYPFTDYAFIKITVFHVQKHSDHATNYESFVNFIGLELKEKVLVEHFQFSETHENDTYLSQTSVPTFFVLLMTGFKMKLLKQSKMWTHHLNARHICWWIKSVGIISY